MATGTVSGYIVLDFLETNREDTFISSNSQSSSNDQSSRTVFTNNYGVSGTISGKITCFHMYYNDISRGSANLCTKLSSSSSYTEIKSSWSDVIYYNTTGSDTSKDKEVDFSLTVPDGDSFVFYSVKPRTYTGKRRLEYSFAFTKAIEKEIFTHKSLPRELKSLGNKCKTTLFGYHIDDSWYEGE